MSSSVKNVLEETVKGTVHNFCGSLSNQLSDWLTNNKSIEISPEELCEFFEVPFRNSSMSGIPTGASIQTQMPSLPNYYAGTGATTPKKKGGRTKTLKDPSLANCTYVMTRGAKTPCPNPVLGDGTTPGGDLFCKSCLKKAAVKKTIEGTGAKSTLQPPQLPGSVVEISSQTKEKNDELSVIEIPGQPGMFREVNHGFILQQHSDGSVVASSIDDNGTVRELRENERKIALSLGLQVVHLETPAVTTTTATTTAPTQVIVPQVPTIPQVVTAVPTIPQVVTAVPTIPQVTSAVPQFATVAQVPQMQTMSIPRV